jgi:predicted RNase H-like nuclease (RuvC/YqgF family)
MFWTKKIVELVKSDDSLQEVKKQLDYIDRVYAKNDNADHEMTISHLQDAESYRIVESYYVKAKRVSRLTQENTDLKKVLEGNGGWWGQYQRNYEECQTRLANSELHINLEKEMYQKLYEQNRELETKLYMAQRELEILKGEVK